MEKYFNFIPNPRVLAMLGEIDLDWWRCLAEFIDNSIDSFMQSKLQNQDINPQIHIFIPRSSSTLKSINIRDNGPGMSADKLENACRAGWSSRDSFDNLGLFGMGFNIATARLGRKTIVWSTRENDNEWVGAEIDFDELIKKDTFRAERRTKPKIEKNEHGTEIQISNLKPDFIEWIKKSYNMVKVTDILARAYSSVLDSQNKYSGLNIRLYINDKRILPYKYCIWGNPLESDPRFGRSRIFGKVNAYQPINQVIGEFPYCINCGIWLPKDKINCDHCLENNADQKIIIRKRMIYGWLGIQRYPDKNDYGIDFIRNGRAIEMRNKDLFKWTSPIGEEIEEYPIDDPNKRGRIIGQIHIDHCSLTYTKDHFVKEDKAWKEMVEILRDKGTLLPQNEYFDDKNDSPLLKLHQAFRRNFPDGKKKAENWHRWEPLLAYPDDQEAKEMAMEYQNGTKEYQSDDKWMEGLRKHIAELKSQLPSEHGKKDPFKKDKINDDKPQIKDSNPYSDLKKLDISGKYIDNYSKKNWNVIALGVPAKHNKLEIESGLFIPWKLEAKDTKGNYYYFVNEDHNLFNSASFDILDGLLCELSHLAMDISGVTFSQVLYKLREQYKVDGHSEYSLDIPSLREDVNLVYDKIIEKLIMTPDINEDDYRNMFQSLNPIFQASITQKARRQAISEETLIKTGKFLRLLDPEMLNTILEREPQYFFDNKCWNESYESINGQDPELDEVERLGKKTRYLGMLNDLASIFDITDIIQERDFLVRVNTAIRLVTLNMD